LGYHDYKSSKLLRNVSKKIPIDAASYPKMFEYLGLYFFFKLKLIFEMTGIKA
jgi:hypothetical protein